MKHNHSTNARQILAFYFWFSLYAKNEVGTLPVMYYGLDVSLKLPVLQILSKVDRINGLWPDLLV